MKLIIYTDDNGDRKQVDVVRVVREGWFVGRTKRGERAYCINESKRELYRVWGESLRRISNQIVIAG